MSLHTHHMQLSDAQKKKLLLGHPVQLKIHHLEGNHVVILDAEQSKKVHKAKREHKGVRIQLNTKDLVHNNVIHGTGFHSLLSKAKKALYRGATALHSHLKDSGVYDNLKRTAKDQLHQHSAIALRHASDYAHGAINKHAPEFLQSNLHNIVDDQGIHAQNALFDTIEGAGIGKTERFFMNAGKSIQNAAKSKIGKQVLKSVVKVGMPLALNAVSAETGLPVQMLSPALSNVANKQIDGLGLQHMRKRGRPRHGGALMPSGY